MKISVVGLGYVGLPLAIALAKYYSVVGFDKSTKRIAELKKGQDANGEIDRKSFKGKKILFSSSEKYLGKSEIYIITVPTPVNKKKEPDLFLLKNACKVVGKRITKNNIVVVESTVYPGVTEEICGPILQKASGLVCGKDFFLGYSPERINPGDKKHKLETITKVVSGQNDFVLKKLKTMYGKIIPGKIFLAKNIRTAEAAKVIENAQRDINIAFINEITRIFSRLNISVSDVLEAAKTKWNFLDFKPGLVGGHCIGVDPFYLAYIAKKKKFNPEVILAGRKINDSMGIFLADNIHARATNILKKKRLRILILGFTFKENIKDLRNTKVVDIVKRLKRFGNQVEVHDYMADSAIAYRDYQIRLKNEKLNQRRAKKFDCIIGAVEHSLYKKITWSNLSNFLKREAVIFDLKGMWRKLKIPRGIEKIEL